MVTRGTIVHSPLDWTGRARGQGVKRDLVSDVSTWVGVRCLEGCQGWDKSRAITGSVLDVSGGQLEPQSKRSGGKERRKEGERDGAPGPGRGGRGCGLGRGQDGFTLIRASTSPALSLARQLKPQGCQTLKTQESEMGVFAAEREWRGTADAPAAGALGLAIPRHR